MRHDASGVPLAVSAHETTQSPMTCFVGFAAAVVSAHAGLSAAAPERLSPMTSAPPAEAIVKTFFNAMISHKLQATESRRTRHRGSMLAARETGRRHLSPGRKLRSPPDTHTDRAAVSDQIVIAEFDVAPLKLSPARLKMLTPPVTSPIAPETSSLRRSRGGRKIRSSRPRYCRPRTRTRR